MLLQLLCRILKALIKRILGKFLPCPVRHNVWESSRTLPLLLYGETEKQGHITGSIVQKAKSSKYFQESGFFLL